MIRLGSRGRSRPSWLTKGALNVIFGLREHCVLQVTVRDEIGNYRFVCPNLHTYRRAATLFIKEAGTIEWLTGQLTATDVFLDIGANVGLYTIFAARRVTAGRVYAVEPHVTNASALAQNIVLNGILDRTTMLTCALANRTGFGEFSYESLHPGAALNQFGENPQITGVVKELKFGTTVDRLLADGIITPPSIIKMDVDGIELDILGGMREMLSDASAPRSLQVEVDAHNAAAIEALLRQHHYRVVTTHYTLAGLKRMRRGEAPDTIARNLVFERT